MLFASVTRTLLQVGRDSITHYSILKLNAEHCVRDHTDHVTIPTGSVKARD